MSEPWEHGTLGSVVRSARSKSRLSLGPGSVIAFVEASIIPASLNSDKPDKQPFTDFEVQSRFCAFNILERSLIPSHG